MVKIDIETCKWCVQNYGHLVPVNMMMSGGELVDAISRVYDMTNNANSVAVFVARFGIKDITRKCGDRICCHFNIGR